MNLGFNHKPLRSSLLCQSNSSFMCGFRSVGHFAALNGDAKRFEDAFALVFVDVHAKWVV